MDDTSNFDLLFAGFSFRKFVFLFGSDNEDKEEKPKKTPTKKRKRPMTFETSGGESLDFQIQKWIDREWAKLKWVENPGKMPTTCDEK